MADIYTYIILPLLTTIFTGLVGWLGVQLKKRWEISENEKLKRDLAETCVRGVEQVYDYLKGAEKYAKCIDTLTQMLNEKGIYVTDLEIQMLIESAVQKMNAEIIKIVGVENPVENHDEVLPECADCDIIYGGDEK